MGGLHGDLEPHNMMRTPQGRLVLMDFGVSRAVGARRDEHGRSTRGSANAQACAPTASSQR